MKKAMILGVITLTLAACADTRSHISSNATSWEHKEYEVGKAKQDLDEQQRETARHGEAQRVYKNGVPTFR
ncbi:peptidyl-dipeptidase [Kingella kingae]|uniref:peptidyl-dipeptidase n=1 Tax=Kingella kingae TaxID=504 RepID=UPI0002E43417|nr:peptidyl-dipeptidase [Kingella kingae]MDK4536382.1 peptidyl-dipeptidase [Kingella kingae]MDK4538367.1 peptidyl-dipeptidase [Kingella kingae]MDK4547479.1 peptidyl-dipeptidase [Kingella kingae]MDK4556064.1 peptidyl-dipeptidase [Kingella kingae]MDK4585130.1 peptidyl-dipeptidase [Kingella kingae]